MKKLLALLTSTALMTIPVIGIVSCGTGTPNKINEKTNISNTMTLTNIVDLPGSRSTEPNERTVLLSVHKQIIKENRIPSDVLLSDLNSSDYYLEALEPNSVLNNDKDYSGYVVFTVKEDNEKYIGSINVYFNLKIIETEGETEVIIPGEDNGEWVENEKGDPWDPEATPGEGGGPEVPVGPGGGGTGKWPEITDPTVSKYMTDLTRFDVGINGEINENEFESFKVELLKDLKEKNKSNSGKYPDEFFEDSDNFILNFADGYGFDSNGFIRNKPRQKIVFSLQSKKPFFNEVDKKYYIGNFKIAFSNAISNRISTEVIFDEKHPPTLEDYNVALLKNLVETWPNEEGNPVINYDPSEIDKNKFTDWYDFTLRGDLPTDFGEWNSIGNEPFKIARPKKPGEVVSNVLKRTVNDIAFEKETVKIKSIDLDVYGNTKLSDRIVIGDDPNWEEIEFTIWSLGTKQISDQIHKHYEGYETIPEIKREYFKSENNEQAWILQLQKEFADLALGSSKEVELKASIDTDVNQLSFINTLSIKVDIQRKPRYTDKTIEPIKLVAYENTKEEELYNIFFGQIKKNLLAFNDRKILERSNDGLKEAFDIAWKSRNTWVEYKQYMPKDTELQPEILVAMGKICIVDEESVINEPYVVDFNNLNSLTYYKNGASPVSQVNKLADRIFDFAKQQLKSNESFKQMEGVSSLQQDWTDSNNKAIYDILKLSIEEALKNPSSSSVMVPMILKSAVENTPFKGQIEFKNLEIIILSI